MGTDHQSVQSVAGNVSCNNTALQRCTSTETLWNRKAPSLSSPDAEEIFLPRLANSWHADVFIGPEVSTAKWYSLIIIVIIIINGRLGLRTAVRSQDKVPWPRAQPTAYRLYAHSVYDTKAPLQLPFVALYVLCLLCLRAHANSVVQNVSPTDLTRYRIEPGNNARFFSTSFSVANDKHWNKLVGWNKLFYTNDVIPDVIIIVLEAAKSRLVRQYKLLYKPWALSMLRNPWTDFHET